MSRSGPDFGIRRAVTWVGLGGLEPPTSSLSAEFSYPPHGIPRGRAGWEVVARCRYGVGRCCHLVLSARVGTPPVPHGHGVGPRRADVDNLSGVDGCRGSRPGASMSPSRRWRERPSPSAPSAWWSSLPCSQASGSSTGRGFWFRLRCGACRAPSVPRAALEAASSPGGKGWAATYLTQVSRAGYALTPASDCLILGASQGAHPRGADG